MKFDLQNKTETPSTQVQTPFDNRQVQFPIDTLVHLGAGSCSELDSYLAMCPQRILLVEADPLLAENIKKRTAQFQQVQVQCVAVAGRSERVPLRSRPVLEIHARILS